MGNRRNRRLLQAAAILVVARMALNAVAIPSSYEGGIRLRRREFKLS